MFEYLYGVHPSFRQNLVEGIKVENGQDVSKILVISKKDNRDYRTVVLKDIKSQQLQVVDEGYLSEEHPSTTSITHNNDNTQTVTTNNIDVSTTQVQIVLLTLADNNIGVSPEQIESLQYTEGPKSVEYVAVLKDSNGQPYKQLTLLHDKPTNTTTIIDETILYEEIKIIRPRTQEPKVVPLSHYSRP